MRRILLGLTFGLIAVGAALAEPANPPLFPEGEFVEDPVAAMRRASGVSPPVNAVTFSADGLLLVVAASRAEDPFKPGSALEGGVMVWSMARKAPEIAFSSLKGVKSVALDKEGAMLATASHEREVSLWDVEAGAFLQPLRHASLASRVVFSGDGSHLAAGSQDGGLRVWRSSTGAPLRSFSQAPRLDDISLSADGGLLASGGADGSLRLWGGSDEPLRVLDHGSPVTGVSLSADGGLLASGGMDGSLRLWGEGSSEPLRVMDHGSPVTSFALSMDGRLLATGGQDGSVRLWNSQSGASLAVLKFHNERWVWCDAPARRCWRYDDGALLDPPPLEEEVDLRLAPLEAVTLYPEKQVEIQIQAVNHGGGRVFGLRLARDEGPVRIADDSGRRVAVEAGQAIEIPVRLLVTWRSLSRNPQISERILIFQDAHGRRFEARLPVNIRAAWPLWTAAALATTTLLGGLAVFRHPAVTAYSAAPRSLLSTPVERFARIGGALKRAGRFKSVLAQADIEENRFHEAARFMASSPQERAVLLARRLDDPKSPELQEGGVGAALFLIRPNLERLKLNTPRLLLVFDDASQRPEETIERLDRRREALALLIGASPERRTALRALAPGVSGGMAVAPTEAQLTALLIGTDPFAALGEILSEQASLRMISLYRGQDAVDHASMFFGRGAILRKLLRPDLGNGLIVGGRQLGKSSLLKALERDLEAQKECRAHYVSDMRKGEHFTKLALRFGAPPEGGPLGLVEHLAKQDPGRKPVFLLDEADGFVLRDLGAGGETLAQMRDLAGEGRARFVLAGFWGLYSATLDYQSPLRNFAEVIDIGPLEPEACRELIKKPMARLNISFEEEALVEDLLRLTGGRAHLIADICRRMVESLTLEERLLNWNHLKQAVAACDAEALQFWRRLSGRGEEGGVKERANAIDRLLVLGFAEAGEFSWDEALRLFDHENLVGVKKEEIREALRRLNLAYVLFEKDGRFLFTTPLMLERLRAQGGAREFEGERHDFALAFGSSGASRS